MAEDAKGLLGRWARRKTEALRGKPLEDAAAVETAGPVAADGAPSMTPPSPAVEADEPPAKVLSLDDVKLLGRDSDFKPFMAHDVGPEVRNAALKKLFADPHFNVMDGLDTYIDDYSISEPIPESMLRQMVGAKFLGLFDDGDGKDGEAAADRQKNPACLLRESANKPTAESVAQSPEGSDVAGPDSISPETTSQAGSLPDAGASQNDHAHTDLRLQPDHAAPAQDAGHGTP